LARLWKAKGQVARQGSQEPRSEPLALGEAKESFLSAGPVTGLPGASLGLLGLARSFVS
jgi:hypothetical protein